MLKENGKMGFAAFVLCIALILVAIILCAFEQKSDSVTVGLLCCGVAMLGCYFAFQSWNDPDPAERPSGEVEQTEKTDARSDQTPLP